jgi:hypothetical protein
MIEGLATCGFAILMFFCLPSTPATSSFLNEREKAVARLRLLKDGSTAIDTKFDSKKFFKPLSDWKFYVFGGIALCYGTAAAVAGNFLTQIIGRFGYSVVKTNLYVSSTFRTLDTYTVTGADRQQTVAPYVCGTLVLLITAFSSDYFRERGYHLASSLGFVIIGCIMLTALPITNINAGYAATFFITFGAFTPSCLFHTWHQCNDPSEDGRAFRAGCFTFLANLGGIVSANASLSPLSSPCTDALTDLPRPIQASIHSSLGHHCRYRGPRARTRPRSAVLHVERQQKKEQGSRGRVAVERCTYGSSSGGTLEPALQAFLLGCHSVFRIVA